MSNNQSLKGITPDATIAQIINAEKNAEKLLASIGLSPKNHQSETLRSVCQQKKWSEVEVLKWLKKNQNNGEQKLKNEEEQQPAFADNISMWCNYIEKHFLTKNKELLDEITGDFPRVHKVHGNQYEWLKNMRWYLENLEEKLNYYFYFQRQKLFPLLGELENSRREILHGTLTMIKNGIAIIEEDHNEILDLIDAIESKRQGVNNQENDCSTLRILNYNLKTLFAALRKQIEIERENLIPLVKQKITLG